jgi:predicted DNA-binding protein (MmcQ/YjbR family)
MNKENWITVLLDGSVDKEMIFSLLDMSFTMTGSRSTGKKKLGGNRD